MVKNLREIISIGMNEKIREIYAKVSEEEWEITSKILQKITGLNKRQVGSIAAWFSKSFDEKRSNGEIKSICKSVYEENEFYTQMQENVRDIYSRTSVDDWPETRQVLATMYEVNESSISSIAAWNTIYNNK